MSTLSGSDPVPGDSASIAAIEHVIVPRARDLGGFSVRRALPAARRQMVGPFIFLDEMGPAIFAPGQGLDVRPHPHIGLATVTYLFEGEILHRDSLGMVQPIRPGAVNLMTAGSGITHSERTEAGLRATGPRLWGLQTWLALPAASEEIAPAFTHHPVESLPQVETPGARVRVILGELYGARSPVATQSETIYAEAMLTDGAVLPVDPTHDERALYIASGEIEIAGDRFEAGRLLVLRAGDAITVRALSAARVMIVGGEPMDGPRHIWWNFVSSRKDRIDAAKADWQAGRFASVPGETEFIPLPE
jgi:redox-sensitive bicupin YhaK (pirin superfamily)